MSDLVERLDEFDRGEWLDVMRRVQPGLSLAEFDDLWAKFQRDKQRKAMS